MTPPTVTLYGRSGCCLCDDARSALLRVQAIESFLLEEIDITSDDDLHRRFLVRIPVIALDGLELYDYEVDEADLLRRLAGMPSGHPPGYSDLRGASHGQRRRGEQP